jgi:hypothetical protein
MGHKVHLYSNLQQYTENKTLVEVNGATIGQCLDELVMRYPGLKTQLFEKEGKLLSSVLLSLNLQSPNSEQLGKQMEEKDELYLIRIVPGG